MLCHSSSASTIAILSSPRNPANKSSPLQTDVCLYFLAIFLPPLAVFLKRGCNADFLINILLSILGWIPGVIRRFPLSLPSPVNSQQLLHPITQFKPLLTRNGFRCLVGHRQARSCELHIDASN